MKVCQDFVVLEEEVAVEHEQVLLKDTDALVSSDEALHLQDLRVNWNPQ